jgi:hypothetical protein
MTGKKCARQSDSVKLTTPNAPRTTPVKDGPCPLRGPPRDCAARSVLDGGEHGATLGQVGPWKSRRCAIPTCCNWHSGWRHPGL